MCRRRKPPGKERELILGQLLLFFGIEVHGVDVEDQTPIRGVLRLGVSEPAVRQPGDRTRCGRDDLMALRAGEGQTIAQLDLGNG